MNSALGPSFKVTNIFFYASWSVNSARDQEENANAWTKMLCKHTLRVCLDTAYY